MRAVVLSDRMAPRVEVSTEDAGNFRKNLVTILGEERIALGIKQAEELVTGDLGNVVARTAKAR